MLCGTSYGNDTTEVKKMVLELDDTLEDDYESVLGYVGSAMDNGENTFKIVITKVSIGRWKAELYDDKEEIKKMYGD